MRRSLLCLAILLVLPCAAYAEQTSAAGPIRPEMKPAIAAEASAAAAPALDLSFDPAVAAEHQGAALVPQAGLPPAAGAAEGPFSVGVAIKTRRDMGSPAARATGAPPGPPTLADKVEGIVERSSIGLTGTYRF